MKSFSGRSIEVVQLEHYQKIADAYNQHYGDEFSKLYRERFIHKKLFHGMELSGRHVLDAMTGGGQTMDYLLKNNAITVGLDISFNSIRNIKKTYPNSRSLCCSVLNSGLKDESFDYISVVGGLHHMHPHLEATMDELHRLLKPGGVLCFAEPCTGSILNFLRRLWYKFDPLFEENEAAIDLDSLFKYSSGKFQPIHLTYIGGPGYLLILNSLIFRMPRWIKAILTTPLLTIDELIAPLIGRRLACMAIAQLRKI